MSNFISPDYYLIISFTRPHYSEWEYYEPQLQLVLFYSNPLFDILLNYLYKPG